MTGTDRYVRTGEAVPVIYPATLANLTLAISDIHIASERQPGRHVLAAVRGGIRHPLQVWEGGTMTWAVARPSLEKEV